MDVFGLKSDKLERQFDSWKDNRPSGKSEIPILFQVNHQQSSHAHNLFIVFANKRFTDLLVFLAQLVEHRILDPRAAGSNPVGDFLRYHTAKSLQPQDLQFYCTIVPRVRNPPGMNKASPGLIGRRMNTHDICFFYTFISV